MRKHFEVALGTAALALALGAVGCMREESRGANAPSSANVPTTTNAGGNDYGNAGPGSMPNGTGGGPHANDGDVGSKGSSAQGMSSGGAGQGSSANGSSSSSKSSNGSNDDSGFDHDDIKGTGSIDNQPTGVGGGPIDKGTTKPDNGITNDDDNDKTLDPGRDDKGKSDVPKPLEKSSKKKTPASPPQQ